MSDAHRSTVDFLKHHSLVAPSFGGIFKKLALESGLGSGDEEEGMEGGGLEVSYIVGVTSEWRLVSLLRR